MKRRIFLTLSLSILFSCDSVRIFEPEQLTDEKASADYEMIVVQITGATDSGKQELQIFTDGRTILTTNQGNAEMNIVLSDAQMSDIQNTFESNNFNKLQDAYIGFEATFHSQYQIYYQPEQSGKTVVTDMSDIPQDLQNIIDKLNSIIETILNNGLEFTLLADKTVVKKDESLELFFTVKNITTKNIEFEFPTSQLFDIIAQSTPEQFTNNIVWKWSHNKMFTQAINYSTLEAGKSQTFNTTWDCRDNEGKRLTGIYYLTGELVALPGGKSTAVVVTIE